MPVSQIMEPKNQQISLITNKTENCHCRRKGTSGNHFGKSNFRCCKYTDWLWNILTLYLYKDVRVFVLRFHVKLNKRLGCQNEYEQLSATNSCIL